ncbi:MAG: 50S ribosomal protein L23 [Dehalococcoidia bacterium]|jgi:large subunit ribosomal protein L23|nr:50S ribosomal protein L23 [Dehalococcoidia bacterium]
MENARILRRPIVTEKSTILSESGRYVFEVDNAATKHEIARAVEWAFDVTVVKVNTLKVPGKVKRYGRRPSKQPDWKKAIVSLAAGDSIQLFEGA